MNPTGKKFLSLFLVFSLMMLSVNLYAKERRGAKLIITKKDGELGELIEGELITVKENSILLLDTEGKDVSIDIADIKVIKIVKKSHVVKGALGGLLGGAVCGALAALMLALLIHSAVGEEGEEFWSREVLSFMLGGGAGAAPVGAIFGGIVGGVAGIDKSIQIEGMSDSKIQKALDKLRKKARVRDYK